MKIKESILEFTTGLGFYGLGLLAAAAVTMLFGWSYVSAAFVGAFVFKNYKAIYDHFRSII